NPLRIRNHQALLALGVLAERDGAGDFRQHAGVLRRTCLEQFGHARQTAGDVAGLGAFLRNPREHLADLHLLTVLHRDQRTDLEGDVHRVIGAGDLHFLALLVEQFHLRTDALAAGAATLRIDDHQRRQTGDLVDLLRHGDAFFHVLELHRAGVFRNDRTGVRIPVRQDLTRLDRRAVVAQQRRAVGQLVPLALASGVVGDQHFRRPGDDDLFARAVGHIAHLRGEARHAVGFRLDLRGLRGTRSRAADVESPHRELRARLADRLRGDHAHRLADVYQRTAIQVAAVALGVQAPARLAGQRRTDFHL